MTPAGRPETNPLRWRRLPAATALLLVVLGPASLRAERGPEVELISMGPGPDLFTRFGHSALRVRSAGSDLVYNFGHTNFDEKGLIWRFLRGEAVFWVEAQSFARTLSSYSREDRSIYRQALRLSPAQHRELARLLAWNARPENRRYRYHHFRDNCATRPRDLVDRVSGGLARQQLDRPSGLRLRALVREGFAGRLDILLLAELLLGRALDQPLSLWDACFLPRIMMEALPTVKRPDGEALASRPEAIYLRMQPSPLQGDPRAGERLLWWLALLIALISATMVALARARPRPCPRPIGLLLAIAALPLGAAGLLVWTLASLTSLPELRWNENLLLLWPTDLFLLGAAGRWLRGRWRAGRCLRSYALARAAVPLVAAAGHGVGWLQQRPLSFLLMSMAFGAGLLLLAWLPPPPSRTRPESELPPCESGAG